MLQYIESGVEINSKNFEDITGIKMWKFLEYFSGIKIFYEANGFEYKFKKKREVSKDELVADVLSVRKMLGSIKQETYLQYGKYSKAIIKREFGNFNSMLRYIGINQNVYKDYKSIHKSEIIENMWEVYNKYGKLNASLQRKYSKYSQNIIDFHFGSFNNLLDEMGLSPNLKKYSIDDILYNLKLIYYKFGTLSSEIIDRYCITSYVTCLNKIGNMDCICNRLHVHSHLGAKDSSGSLAVEYILNDIGVLYEKEKQWDWLVNPKTGRPLFIDFYLPEHNLCIEYNEMQHYTYVKLFHGSYSRFIEACERDAIKKKLILSHEYRFETIKYDENIATAISNILY